MAPMSKLTEQLKARAAAVRSATDPGSTSAIQIPLEQIKEDPDQPRRHFSEAEMDEITSSIKRRGILQPITVRPKNDDCFYIIKFGARRFRGAGRAGLNSMPCIVRAITDQDDQDQMIENIQRADLTPEEWAQYIEKQRAKGKTDTQIGEELGVSKHKIYLYAAVLKLPGELRPYASVMGARELHELHSLWREAPEIASTLLAANKPEELTRSMIIGARQQAAADQKDEEPGAPVAIEPTEAVASAAPASPADAGLVSQAEPVSEGPFDGPDAKPSLSVRQPEAPKPREEAPAVPAKTGTAADGAATGPAREPAKRSAPLSFVVAHEGRRGVLHSTQAPSTPWMAVVTFDSGPEEVRIEKLELVEVKA